MCVCPWMGRTHRLPHLVSHRCCFFFLGAQPLTGRQCEHSKQKPGSFYWPLPRSCRQVVVVKWTVPASAQCSHCGPRTAAPQDMSSVGLCQCWPSFSMCSSAYLYIEEYFDLIAAVQLRVDEHWVWKITFCLQMIYLLWTDSVLGK